LVFPNPENIVEEADRPEFVIKCGNKKPPCVSRAAKLFCQGLYTIQLVLGLDWGFLDLDVWIFLGLDLAVVWSFGFFRFGSSSFSG
jgi:hypothetical protein